VHNKVIKYSWSKEVEMKYWLVVGLSLCVAALFTIGCGEEQKPEPEKKIIPPTTEKKVEEPKKETVEPKKEEPGDVKKAEPTKDDTKKDEGKKEETK